MKVRRSWVGAALAVAVMTGCGVTTQSSPQLLATPAAPTVAPPSGPTTHVTDIYLVRGSRVVAAARPIPDPLTLDRILQSLLSGPTPRESSNGLRSALPSTVLLRSADVRSGTAYLDLSEGLSNIDSDDQAFAIAQLVATSTDYPDVSLVQIMVEGEPVQVPRADGTATDQPVSRSDYAGLFSPAG